MEALVNKIKKGDRFLCLLDYIMNDEEVAYKCGKVYESLKDGSLKSEVDKSHLMPIDSEFNEYFELVTENKNHYDNSKGSIYKFCEDQKLNPWEFDIIKRVVRCRKKGQFIEDLEKTKVLIDLYIKEHESNISN